MILCFLVITVMLICVTIDIIIADFSYIKLQFITNLYSFPNLTSNQVLNGYIVKTRRNHDVKLQQN